MIQEERISIADANKLTVRYILIPIAVLGLSVFAVSFKNFDFSFIRSADDIGFWIWMLYYCCWVVGFVAAIFVGIVLHEGIHGVFIALFAGWKELRFGFDKKTKSPFAHSKKKMRAWQMIIVCIAPLVVLGFGLIALGVIYGSLFLYLLGMIFTIAAGGDILYVKLLTKVPMVSFVKDLPDAVGFSYE